MKRGSDFSEEGLLPASDKDGAGDYRVALTRSTPGIFSSSDGSENGGSHKHPDHFPDAFLRKFGLDAASMMDDFYTVVGTRDGEGGVIVSKFPEPVDFAASLTNRVANFVPMDSIDDVIPRIDAYCQTIGIYPESFVPEIQDRLALAGGQRLVTLGHAAAAATGFGGPQDGIEPVRRLCKWVFREEADPEKTRPVWA